MSPSHAGLLLSDGIDRRGLAALSRQLCPPRVAPLPPLSTPPPTLPLFSLPTFPLSPPSPYALSPSLSLSRPLPLLICRPWASSRKLHPDRGSPLTCPAFLFLSPGPFYLASPSPLSLAENAHRRTNSSPHESPPKCFWMSPPPNRHPQTKLYSLLRPPTRELGNVLVLFPRLLIVGNTSVILEPSICV